MSVSPGHGLFVRVVVGLDLLDLAHGDFDTVARLVLELALLSRTVRFVNTCSTSSRKMYLPKGTPGVAAHIALFSEILLLRRDLGSQSGVSQEMLAVDHFNFQLLL